MTFQGPAEAATSRRLMAVAMAGLGQFLRPERLHDLDLALTEACANVVRHAYAGCPRVGDLRIDLRLEPGQAVTLAISDWGQGFQPETRTPAAPGPDSEGGRGLYLMGQLCQLRVERQEGQTTVFLHSPLASDDWVAP